MESEREVRKMSVSAFQEVLFCTLCPVLASCRVMEQSLPLVEGDNDSKVANIYILKKLQPVISVKSGFVLHHQYKYPVELPFPLYPPEARKALSDPIGQSVAWCPG